MNRYKKQSEIGLAVVATFIAGNSLMTNTAVALPADFEAAIDIEAEYVEVDSANRSSVYRGNVRFGRGTMQLTADEVRVTQDEKTGAVHATVLGKPATYSQIPREDAGRVTAEADKIEYRSEDAVIRLLGEASIHRGADVITSPEIRYHMKQDRIIAGDGDGRVKITIQPPSSKNSAVENSE